MAKHIGIVACSAEGAALCYRTICQEAEPVMGEYMHPEISMHTHPLGDYMPYITGADWKGVADLMISSAKKVSAAGADFAICPDNTIHEAFEWVRQGSPIPWLHIAECVAQKAREAGYKRLGVTGTKYLMTGPVYSRVFEQWGIGCEIPDADDRERIDRIIFGELVKGNVKEESRLYFNEVAAKLKARGCSAVVLGCTEIPLLVDPQDCPLPTLDSTRLLARAALRRAIEP